MKGDQASPRIQAPCAAQTRGRGSHAPTCGLLARPRQGPARPSRGVDPSRPPISSGNRRPRPAFRQDPRGREQAQTRGRSAHESPPGTDRGGRQRPGGARQLRVTQLGPQGPAAALRPSLRYKALSELTNASSSGPLGANSARPPSCFCTGCPGPSGQVQVAGTCRLPDLPERAAQSPGTDGRDRGPPGGEAGTVATAVLPSGDRGPGPGRACGERPRRKSSRVPCHPEKHSGTHLSSGVPLPNEPQDAATSCLPARPPRRSRPRLVPDTASAPR